MRNPEFTRNTITLPCFLMDEGKRVIPLFDIKDHPANSLLIWIKDEIEFSIVNIILIFFLFCFLPLVPLEFEHEGRVGTFRLKSFFSSVKISPAVMLITHLYDFQPEKDRKELKFF